MTQRRWQWIDRILGKDMISVDGHRWKRCTEVYAETTAQAREYVNALYVRSNPTNGRLVLVKREAKGGAAAHARVPVAY